MHYWISYSVTHTLRHFPRLFLQFCSIVLLVNCSSLCATTSQACTKVTPSFQKGALGTAIPYTTDRETVEKLIQQDPNLAKIAPGLVKAFSFIEMKTSMLPSQSSYQKKVIEKTVGGDIVVEILPKLRASVIYLPENTFFIGEGLHKKVAKVIFIRDAVVSIAAHCWGGKSTKQEVEVLTALQNTSGIVPFLGAVSRDRGEYYSIFLLYCDGGELRSFVNVPKQTLCFRQEMIIAKGITQGLKSIHTRGYIHYDIHAGNVFLIKNRNGDFEGVLGDFGYTFLAKKASTRSAYVAARRVPSEALVESIYKIDRYKTDIHALGSVFFEIAWHDYHPWGFILPRANMHVYPKSERKKYYKKIVSQYRETKERLIGKILKKKKILGIQALTAQERFKILVFSTMHFNPIKRPPLDKILQEIDTILNLL